MTDRYAGPERREITEPPFWFPTIRGFLTFSIVFLIVAIVLILMLRPPQVDERISNLLSGILGILVACFKDVYGYNFNSTYETQVQNKTIADQGKALAVSAPPAPTVTKTTLDPGPPATATTTTGPAPDDASPATTTTMTAEPAPKP